MANLLRWSTGLTFPKKKEENNVLTTSTPLIKSLRTMNPTVTNKANSATTNNTNNSFSNSIMHTQQINEQIRQQAEQRRQQEEQQRQQRIAEQQRQQEQRKQQEQAKRLAEQRLQEQKQRNLLNSAGLGNNNFNTSNFRANLEAQKQARIQKQQQEAEAKNNTWKKYYDEEKQKVRDQAFKNNWGESTLQDIFNAGWDSRLAETNARNRYTSELMRQGRQEEAKKHAAETMNVARQYGEQERANSRAIGASYDSEIKDNPFLATFNAIRKADIGNAMLGGAEGGVADVAKFLINTGQYAIPVAGWSQGILRGAPSVVEALAGRGLDKSTGNYKDLNLLERAGRGISGGIDVVGPKLNASEKLAGGLLNLLKGGTKEVAKQGGKAALMEFAKNALGEGIEEGVQEIGDYFGDSNTLTDENGNISGEKIGQLAGQVGQSAALGALGGGLMSGANIVVGKAANNINARRNANVDTNVDTNIDTNINEDTNVDTSNVQTTQDGTMVKTNVDGTATKLSDAEMANVVEQPSYKASRPLGTNPFIENSIKLNSSEDIATLAKRAEQGDTYAKQRLAELTGQNEEENTGWQGKSVEEVINPEDTKQAQKEAQFQTLQETNPMRDDYHTGIRSANEINYLNDLVKNYNADTSEMFAYPDFTLDDAKRAISKGEIEVFSSKPIEAGAFVTPSRMMAQDYAGSGEVYSKVIPIEDFAAIRSGDEGNYLPRGVDIKTPSELDESPKVYLSERDAYGEAADRAEIEKYYKQYGENFYEKMPEDLQTKYEDMLSMQARDENGVYKDPITGEEWVDQTSTNLSDDIDDVLSNPNRRQPVKLRDNTPEALVGLGIKDLPMYENPSHMRNNILTESEAKNAGVFRDGDNYHGLGKDAFMEAIAGLDVPRAVFKRNDGSNDFLILTSAKDGNGNTVIVPVQIQTTTNANYMDIDTNRVKTVFGYDDKAGLNQYIKNNIKRGEFTKIDPGEAVIAAPAGSNESVSQNGSKVNANDPLVQYYRKYGDDFYDKLPENLKNRYEDMLDSQPRDGNGRYTDPITGETWIDEKASVNGKKSQFAENTSGNRNFSTETRGELKSDPLTYKPTTNEERLTRANEVLSTKSSDEIDNYLRENFFNVKPKDADSADMVLAGEYAKMLDAKGQFDRSTEIINRMSEIGTKQGQNIQALSLMMNRSPEGIANMAQTAIKKSGGEMTPELRRQIVEKTQEIGRTRNERTKLSEENAKISEQIMNGKGDLTALRKRQMQIGQAYRLNLDQEGRQFSRLSDVVSKNSPDKRSVFGSIWRAGLLSGPRTHTGNAVSNTFQNVLNAGADRFASGLDWARTKITGGEREVVSSAGGRKEGLKRGLKAAGEVLKTGDNLWESTDTILGKSDLWGQGGELEFKNKVANNMVAKPTNYVFRAMSAGDLPFRYAAFENAIRTEAKRQGINQGYKGQALQDYINSRVATPDPELQAYGVRKGNESVYDMDTKLSDLMNRIDKYIDSQDNKVVKNIMKGSKTLVAPFVKVPSKVLSTAVDYSPLGSVKAIVNKIGSKGYTTGQFETDLAKSGLGTAGFVGLGYALSAAGLLTGGYPDSQEERDRWRAEGIEPNSIKIGDKYLSLNYLGPASMLMAMGSGVQQRQANGEDPLAITQGVLTDTMTTFLDQSYVQGLNNVLNAVTDSKRYGESYINSLARGLTPNLFRQVATATDPKQRQVNNPLEAIISGIPGASQTLDAKVDVYGREIENKQALPLGQAWDALKLSNSRETNDVIDEVNRLHNIDPSNKDLQVTPSQAQSTISVNGVNVKLTDDQKTQLQKDIGEAAVASMGQVMNSSEYKNLTDEQKAKALDKARGDAQSQVRKQFIEANNITSDNNPGTKNSGGSISENYANKAISNATSNRTNGTIGVNDSISNDSKSILNKYNSMTSNDWNDYLYGTSADSAAAEYSLAKAKYENDLANDKLTEPQKIKREKELAKLEVSQKWTKEYRDAYSLAGTKADMQAYLDGLDAETRAKTVATLNGLNNAMYNAGIITASTYKTRYNAINNTTSSKSGSRKSSSTKSEGISSAEASALASLAKTMVKADDNVKVKTPEAPTTKRKMSKTKSSGNKTQLATYTPSGKKSISVSKGAKKSIA